MRQWIRRNRTHLGWMRDDPRNHTSIMPGFLKRRWLALFIGGLVLTCSFVEEAGWWLVRLPRSWSAGLTKGTWIFDFTEFAMNVPPHSIPEDEFAFGEVEWMKVPSLGIAWPPFGIESLHTSNTYVFTQLWVPLGGVIIWIAAAEVRHRRRHQKAAGMASEMGRSRHPATS